MHLYLADFIEGFEEDFSLVNLPRADQQPDVLKIEGLQLICQLRQSLGNGLAGSGALLT
ncbi:hypothetical protein SDC9_177228 [bioreactor metagenome]|uniref:Uncharacterized protein n=1 Tax=bioreactor metagenome TaxID=1076179 RepID=A0A645GSQ7_9ZZZZ